MHRAEFVAGGIQSRLCAYGQANRTREDVFEQLGRKAVAFAESGEAGRNTLPLLHRFRRQRHVRETVVMKTRREKKRVIRLLILCMLCSIFFSHIRERDYVQDRLIAEIDRQCSGEGECMLDLAEAFSDFAWDAVSVYMAGNSRQIREALGVYTEAEDGIVFSKDGIPILEHQSWYQFPQDIPADVSYYVIGEDADDPYYVTLPFENAIVHAEKYKFLEDYKYKILVYCSQDSDLHD